MSFRNSLFDKQTWSQPFIAGDATWAWFKRPLCCNPQ